MPTWKRVAASVMGIVAGGAATAQEVPLPPSRPAFSLSVPLPPPRPPVLGPPAPRPVFGPSMPPKAAAASANLPQQPVPAAATAGDEMVCLRLLTSRTVVARVLPAVGPTPEGCAMPAPVEVSAVIVSPTRQIPFEPPVTVNCPLGEALSAWVREDLVPAFANAPAPLAALVSTSGYACRGRNRVVGAKLSEHARGNAADIGGFRLANGTTIGVKETAVPVMGAVRTTGCARFATVLGPGSDGFHESHMHVDLEPRRHGSKICHWDL